MCLNSDRVSVDSTRGVNSVLLFRFWRFFMVIYVFVNVFEESLQATVISRPIEPACLHLAIEGGGVGPLAQSQGHTHGDCVALGELIRGDGGGEDDGMQCEVERLFVGLAS